MQEMETATESELQLILPLTLMELESLNSIKDLTHMEMEIHLLLDSKILLMKTTMVEEKLLKSKDKSQTQEMETATKLEPQLIQLTMNSDQKLSDLEKDLTLLEMEIPMKLVFLILTMRTTILDPK